MENCEIDLYTKLSVKKKSSIVVEHLTNNNNVYFNDFKEKSSFSLINILQHVGLPSPSV